MLLYVALDDEGQSQPVPSLRKKNSISKSGTIPPGPRIAYSYQVELI